MKKLWTRQAVLGQFNELRDLDFCYRPEAWHIDAIWYIFMPNYFKIHPQMTKISPDKLFQYKWPWILTLTFDIATQYLLTVQRLCWILLKPVLGDADGSLHFPLQSMNRLNLTVPAIMEILLFWAFFRSSFFCILSNYTMYITFLQPWP